MGWATTSFGSFTQLDDGSLAPVPGSARSTYILQGSKNPGRLADTSVVGWSFVAADEEPANEPEYAEPLTIWSRILCGLVGVGGLGAGTAAVFITKNSAGTGVLLGVGALFAVMAATGNPITRAKLGDSELTWRYRRLSRVVTAVMEEGLPEVKAEVADAVFEANLPAGDPVRLAALGVAYERSVIEALRRLGVEDVTSEEDMDNVSHGRTDMLGLYKGHFVGFEIKGTARPLSDGMVANVIDLASSVTDQMRRSAAKFNRRFASVLIVAGSQPTSRAWEILSRHPDIRWVKWTGAHDDEALRLVLDQLVDDAANT